MPAALSGTVLLLRMLVAEAARGGVDVSDLLAAHGVTAAALADDERRMPHDLLLTLWQELPRRLGDAAFGLHLAQQHRPGAFDLIDFAVLNAPDLGGCIRRVLRYQRIAHDAAGLRLELDDRHARVVHLLPAPDRADALRHVSEWALALVLGYGRRLVGALAPVAVHLAHPAPADRSPHEHLFAAPLHFAAARSELVFLRGELARPALAGDPELGRLLVRHADERLARLPGEATLIDRVRQAVAAGLEDGAPEAPTVARALGLSERSFFRRLREQGTSFHALVEQVRRERALQHMRDPRLSLSQIAFLLGYSEVSAFHRAFRRWTGESPSAHRRAGA